MVFEISKYLNNKPKIDKTVFVAQGSNVLGSVEIKKNSSVWFNCTIRADVNFISIGEKTNIQDGTTIHVSSGGFSATGGAGSPTIIGDNVTIVKKNELWAGNPGRPVRKLKQKELELIDNTPLVYEKLAKEFLKNGF